MDRENISVVWLSARSSIYRGVTKHKRTGIYEAHLWDNSFQRDGHNRKGRQVYLGGFDEEEKTARAYDLAAVKFWGPLTPTNFPVKNYGRELKSMKNMSKQAFVQYIRRISTGFSRGASIYRGVTRYKNDGKWHARIGRGRDTGNKDFYLGTFNTEEEAAEAYDIANIKLRGENAITNFDTSRYDVEAIMNSTSPGGVKSKSISAEVQDEENTGNKDDSLYYLLSLEPTTVNVERSGNISFCTDNSATINGNAISKTMATTHGLVMGDSSVPSYTSLAAPFCFIQEGSVVSKAPPAFKNMLSLGTSTLFSHGESSGLVRTGHENMNEDSESENHAGAACQPPIMFNIWSDIRMSKS